ncbi:MAG: aldo/keto reductase [Halobacteriota archaeon]
MRFHRLGLGTYQNEDHDQCANSVATAIDVGYRHIDTAQGYDNEAAVGAGIERSGVDREEVFVATKLSTDNLAYDDVIASTERSAEKLGVETIDLMYVHWPLNTYDPAETIPALNELVDRGLAEHVGLSNFRPDQLADAIDRLDVPLFAHQVEMHPLFQQAELREYAREDDHWLVAYSPIARNAVADVPELLEIADKHDSTPAQISLAWLLANDHVAPIPKATGEEHIRENFEAQSIDLDAADLETIDSIDRRRRVVDFEEAPWNQVD